MEKESKKSIGENLNALTAFIKNAKFLVLFALALVTFGLAVVSGDVKSIALNFYESLTGQKYADFSPVTGLTAPTYVILKDKISRDKTFGFENAEVSLFEESASLHRYRVRFNDQVYTYSVKKKQDGIWHIYEE